MIMAVSALLDQRPNPTDKQIDATITNAIYAASGVRVRTLPIKNQELRRA